MKKTKIGILKGLLLAGALVFAGCSGVLDDVTKAQTSGGATGTVLVEIGSPADARTLAPASSGITQYVLGYTKDTAEAYVYADASASKTLNLEPGVWYFSAIGYQDAAKTKAVAKGETTVTVRAGEAVTASILLSEAGDVNVPGYFKYDVEWSAIASTYAGTTEVSLSLTPADEVSDFGNTGRVVRDLRQGNRGTLNGTDTNGEVMTAASNNHTTGTIPLPSGVYNLDIAVTTPDSTSIAGENTTIHRKEKVYIYSYLTTVAPLYTFTKLDIAKVILRGSRPQLAMGLYNYDAASSEIWSERSITGTSKRLTYSTGNTTTEENQTLTYTTGTRSSWELYLAGYQLEPTSAVNPSSTVWFRTRWAFTSGDDIYLWTEVKLEQPGKQIFDIDLDAKLSTIDREYLIASPTQIPYISTTVQPTFSTGTRSSIPGELVKVEVRNIISTTVTGMQIVQHRIRTSDGGAYDKNTFIPYSDITYTTGTYATEFTMPLTEGDGSDYDGNAWTVDPANPNVTLITHFVTEGDVIRGGDAGVYSSTGGNNPDALYMIIAESRTSAVAGSPPTAKLTIMDIADITDASHADGLYRRDEITWRYLAIESIVLNQWGVPDILDLSRAIYASRAGLSSANANFAAAARYWSSSQGRGSTFTGTRYIYRNSNTTAYSTPSLTASIGAGFNKIYTAASDTDTNYYSLTTNDGSIDTDNDSMKAHVRLIQNLEW